MSRSLTLAILLAAMISGCATPPPTSRRLVTHAAAAEAAGTLLLVDVCLNYSPIGSDDYFVTTEARRGAGALEVATQRFLDATDVKVRTRLVPFVCGALHDDTHTPKRFAEAIDGEVSTRRQPLWVAPELDGDPDYVQALQTLATHVFRSSLAAASEPAAASAPAAAPPPAPEGVRRAAELVSLKTGRSSLIYIGVTGHSLSSGKATAFGVARVVAGVAMSLAIGPVFTAGTTSYGVVFLPGGPVDKRQMVAGLLDLRQFTMVATRVVHGGGDPMKPEVLASREALDLLLRDLVLTTAPK